jgi:hypothetical protein
MQGQLLAPGVQHGDHPGLRPQVRGILREVVYRAPRRSEQRIVERLGMVHAQGVELRGQGEHQVEAIPGGQFGLAQHHPPLALCALAAGAVPVAARVVADAHRAACAARIHVATHGRGAAPGDGPQGAQVMRRPRIPLQEVLSVPYDHLRQAVARAAHHRFA